MPKLNKRLIDSLQPPVKSDLFVWDIELKGFAVRLKPSGAATYIVQYRTPQGRTRRLAFGKVGTLTPQRARDKAKELLRKVEDGNDPSQSRHEERAVLIVGGPCSYYIEACEAGLVLTRFRIPKAASSIIDDKSRISRTSCR